MTIQDKQAIANSFSDMFDTFEPNIKLSFDELQIFEEGVYASNMDEKWNIFILNNFIYWAHSWTDACIYKVQLNKQDDFVQLEKVFVTRDKKQYRTDNIDEDQILFLELLQVYIGREDIYVDPAFEFELVKQILNQHKPLDNYIKSIGRQSVSLNKTIYQSLLHFGNDYVLKTGWTDFYEKIKNMNDDEDILSLYLQEKETNKSMTFNMDKSGHRLINVIVSMDISSR